MSANVDDPIETLASARTAIAQHYDAAYWLGMRSALQPAIRPLVDLGHARLLEHGRLLGRDRLAQQALDAIDEALATHDTTNQIGVASPAP